MRREEPSAEMVAWPAMSEWRNRRTGTKGSIMRRILIAIASIAVLALLATPSFALITFDPSTGIGGIGKGDIQQLLGLKNNAAAQAWYETYGATVEFRYRQHARYLYDCVGLDNKSEPASKDGHVTVNVNATPELLSRGQSNWAGFSFVGLEEGGGSPHNVPVAGEECSEGNVDGLIENVQVAANPAPTNELLMKWGTSETPIPF